MPEKVNFSQPQRQSVVGLALIFGTALYRIGRNLWVLLVYFFIGEFSPRTLFLAGAGLLLLLLISLGYSIVYYLNFKFHIDEKNQEFILQKGVFSTDILNIPFQKIQQVNFRRNILQRAIGVYSVVVETAGSEEKEVEIKALYGEKANALAERLLAHAEEEDTESEAGEGEEKEAAKAEAGKNPEWEHEVDLTTLMKLGLTSNYLRGVGIIIAFYFTLREQFMLDESLPQDFANPEIYWAKGKFLLVIVLLVIGMIITVGETVIKYFGLKIQKVRDRLQVEMGLRENTKVSLRASRIQLLQVITNPLQKRMQLYQVKLSLASSRDELEKNQIKVVGLPPAVVGQVKQYFYKSEVGESFLLYPSKFLLWRKMSRAMIPLLVASILLFLYAELVTLSWFVSLGLLYLVLISSYNYLYYKSLKLQISKEFIIKYSGVWSKKEEILETFKLQGITTSLPLWYKKRGLINISLHSAGGNMQFQMLHKDQVQPLFNFLVYRIESSSRPWM